MKNTHKKFMVLLLVFVMLIANVITSDALADGQTPITLLDILPTTSLQQIKNYLQTQYDNTNTNSTLSANMGYLFALKAINYAIAGTSYSQMDCSKLTYTALKEAYTAKGLVSYYIFGSSRKTAARQYTICSNCSLLISDAQKQTGDLIFWQSQAGRINHVGIYLNYNGSDYIIESRENGGGAVVTNYIWHYDNYEIKGYARVNKALMATYRLGSPFTGSLGLQKVLYNCPPSPPTPPTYSGYTFTSWTPSVTIGMTTNTTYIAHYINQTVSKAKDGN